MPRMDTKVLGHIYSPILMIQKHDIIQYCLTTAEAQKYREKLAHIQITNGVIKWALHLSRRVTHSRHWAHAQRWTCNVNFISRHSQNNWATNLYFTHSKRICSTWTIHNQKMMLSKKQSRLKTFKKSLTTNENLCRLHNLVSENHAPSLLHTVFQRTV